MVAHTASSLTEHNEALPVWTILMRPARYLTERLVTLEWSLDVSELYIKFDGFRGSKIVKRYVRLYTEVQHNVLYSRIKIEKKDIVSESILHSWYFKNSVDLRLYIKKASSVVLEQVSRQASPAPQLLS